MYVKTVFVFCNSIHPLETLNVCFCKLDVCLIKTMNVFVCYSWQHRQLLPAAAAAAAGSHIKVDSRRGQRSQLKWG